MLIYPELSSIIVLDIDFTSKGSYHSWKKIVKVWMMMMMKEKIFTGHPSLALPPLYLESLALASLALALLALNLLAFARLTHVN